MGDDEKPAVRERSGFVDRRKRTDWVSNMATVLSVVSWFIAFGVWGLLDKAQPDKENFFSRALGLDVRQSWDTSLLQTAFFLLIAAFVICVLAFVFNMLRKRRRSDKYKKSIIIIGGITLLGIILFIVRFGPYLT